MTCFHVAFADVDVRFLGLVLWWAYAQTSYEMKRPPAAQTSAPKMGGFFMKCTNMFKDMSKGMIYDFRK